MAERDMGTSEHNISTEHQPPGDAKRPADTLDRDQAPNDKSDNDQSIIGRDSDGD